MNLEAHPNDKLTSDALITSHMWNICLNIILNKIINSIFNIFSPMRRYDADKYDEKWLLHLQVFSKDTSLLWLIEKESETFIRISWFYPYKYLTAVTTCVGKIYF